MRTVQQTSQLVIVSNRLPVHRVRRRLPQDESGQWRTSPGGLVSALKPVLREASSAWVGWPGVSETIAPFEHDGIWNIPVAMSHDEVKAFYEGFSNRILWPLYHDAIRPPEYRQNWWKPYVEVNRRFARAAADAVEQGGVVWVHDYHLQLLPQMLRALRPDIRIGFFLHIPFPPQELFAQLPWREEILQGLLGADVVGFQTAVGAQNFVQVAQRYAGAQAVDHTLHFERRSIDVGAFPISVDVAHFEELAASDEVIQRAAEFRVRLGSNRRMMLGLDRLDYTKGIDLRLKAFHKLLRTRKATSADCVFVQVAIPSREHVQEYKELRIEVEQLVGEINGEFGEIGRMPVQYLHRSVPPRDLVALYLAADVMIVTPLRDGMNLVAKEYIASRIDNRGVLVLSEFTGAAREFHEAAVLVNPHDLEGLAGSMERALLMSPREQTRRMQAMREIVRTHDVHHWAQSFMSRLAYVRV